MVLEVPADGLFDPLFELQAGLPAQLVFEFARVDGVSQVVTRAVGDIRDQLFRSAFGIAQQPVHGFDDHPYQVDVLPFVETPDVVRVGDLALVEDHVDGPCVVLDVEPVADVLPAAVHGQRPSVADVVDEQRNQLLRELVGPVVVRAVRNQRRHAVRVVVGPHEVVRRSLRRRVGAVRVVLRLLGEELLAERTAAALAARRVPRGAGQLQRTVHFVGRDVVEQLARPIAVPMLPRSFEQRQRTHDVRTREGKRIPDRAVHVALGCEVDHPVDAVLPEQFTHRLEVADVAPDESVVRPLLDVSKVGEVASIGQLVEVDDPVIGVFGHEKTDHMRADEARAARDEDSALHSDWIIRRVVSGSRSLPPSSGGCPSGRWS